MKTTQRFERAVTKLYTAFHECTLNAMDCKYCAVGNMCDRDSGWSDVIGCGNSMEDVSPKRIEEIMNIYMTCCPRDYKHGLSIIRKTGYSPMEIATVEAIFLDAHPFANTKEAQFKGLCAVVEYLCELDGIPNVIDYSSLFEYDAEGPKKELQTVFK